MLSFLHKYAKNIHSQNGEDGVIEQCVERLELAGWLGDVRDEEWSPGHAVEIGANDGLWLSNTRHLIESGWSGLFVEGQYDLYLKCKQNWQHNPRVRSQCCYVDERNIKAFVDERCALLSLDTDGSDYMIFDGLQAKPKIVIAEIDSSLNPDFSSFNSDGGANYFAMTLLGITKGYFLLCHTGNLVFVDEQFKHLFPEIDLDPLADIEYYFNRAWLRNEAA